MNSMLIAKKLTDIDEQYILESDPSAVAAAHYPRGTSALSRFLSSGIAAAVISGVVALGVLVAIVMAGRVDPVIPPVSTEETNHHKIIVYEIGNQSDHTSVYGTHNYTFMNDVSTVTDTTKKEESVAISVGDLRLEGAYELTKRQELFGTVAHQYVGVDSHGRTVEFAIDEATGLLSNLFYPDMPHKTEHILTRQDCMAVAQDFIANVVVHSDEYTIYRTEEKDIPEYGGKYYAFYFSRKIGELYSDDELLVKVSAYGIVEYYLAQYMPELSANAKLTFDRTEIEKIISDKLLDIYGASADTVSYTHEIVRERVTRLHDGNDYLRYKIRVFIQPENKDEYNSVEDIELVIQINN